MQKTIDNITGVVVSYDDCKIITESVMSVLKLYPNMKIIIVDGSPDGSPCKTTVKNLHEKNESVKGFLVNKNIGHGPGMHFGIEKAKTDFVLVFDSDIILHQPRIEEMFSVFDHDEVLCCGNEVYIDKRGEGLYPDKRPVTKENGGCPYIHPYFELINRKEYFKYKPFLHHGSPCIHTMFDVFNKGLSDKVLRNFPQVQEFVHHPEGGTRLKYPPEFLRDWVNYHE